MAFKLIKFLDPGTGAALAAAGGGLKAGGDIYSGNAAGAAADYNADMALQNAAYARAQSAEEERRARIMGAKQVGNIQAAVGASGVTSDSALDVLRESAANAELNARTIRAKGAMESYGFESGAALDRMKASVARTQGYLSAAGDLLGAGGQAAAGGKGGFR